MFRNARRMIPVTRPGHLPTPQLFDSWPEPSVDDPVRLLVSGCLAGIRVGYDGTTYGEHPEIHALLAHPHLKAFPFCPENLAFGTPRPLCDIHHGDGHDVLAGRAKVISANGEDWTQPMIAAAYAMLAYVREKRVQLALLMDISAACGSQVIYNGARPGAPYLAGHGVCSALLIENGIFVSSQRDLRTLNLLWRKLGVPMAAGEDRFDHHESDWYQSYFTQHR